MHQTHRKRCNYKVEKGPVILRPYTVVKHITMVVEILCAPVAFATVFGSAFDISAADQALILIRRAIKHLALLLTVLLLSNCWIRRVTLCCSVSK